MVNYLEQGQGSNLYLLIILLVILEYRGAQAPLFLATVRDVWGPLVPLGGLRHLLRASSPFSGPK